MEYIFCTPYAPSGEELGMTALTLNSFHLAALLCLTIMPSAAKSRNGNASRDCDALRKMPYQPRLSFLSSVSTLLRSEPSQFYV